jgi:phosphotransferase system enzyme I (PtsI)
MTARSLAAVAAVLKTVTLAEAQQLAKLAMSAPSATEAKAWVREKLPVLAELGL